MKNTIQKLCWKISNLRYSLSCLFKPRQKWLTRVVPRTWCDKPELMRDVLFAFIVDYVEVEDGLRFRGHDWKADLEQGHVSQEYVDDTNKVLDRIYNVYVFIKTDRPRLEQEIKDSDEYCTQAYKMLDDKDKWALKEIVELREYLWT
jgi:hypothetical protein